MRRLVFGLAVLGMFAVMTPLTQADDQAVAQRVVETIQQHRKTGALKGFGIDLQVEEGVVWIKGEVADSQQHQLLIQSLAQLEGVKDVVNDVRIRAEKPVPAAEPATDVFGEIASGVKDLLRLNSEPESATPDVPEIEESVATVPMPQPAAETAPPAQAIARVLQVKPDMPVVDDNAIAQTMGHQLNQLKDAGELQNFNVQVSVSGGTVWVKGFAASQGQQKAILGIAQNIDGVAQVVNDLIIREPASIQVVSTLSEVESQPIAAPFQVTPASALQAPAAPAAPVQMMATPHGVARARYEQPNLPAYAWPTYAAYPNYGQVNYPKQYSASAWPYIGPFYPYPQVPLGWRKVSLEWSDGWWFLDFESN